jgi:hypothetical protein
MKKIGFRFNRSQFCQKTEILDLRLIRAAEKSVRPKTLTNKFSSQLTKQKAEKETNFLKIQLFMQLSSPDLLDIFSSLRR